MHARVPLMMATICLSVVTPAPGADDGLLLHLSFDDPEQPGRDSSAHGNHATVHGEPDCPDSPVSGHALRLDGVDDYLDLGNRQSLTLATDDFTFEAWIRTDARDAYMCIVSTGRYGPGFGLFSLTLREENVLSTDYRCRDERGRICWRRRQEPPTLPPLITRQPTNNDRWHHVAIVVDRDRDDGLPRIYRDGGEVTGGPAISGGPLPAGEILVSNSDPMHIGAASPQPQRFFAGLIDEVRLYRRALPEDEIVQRYEASAPDQPPPDPIDAEQVELPEVTAIEWEIDEFVIMPWGGPSPDPDPEGNDALPEVLRAAHFNVVLCGLDDLDLCREWGFRALVQNVSPEQAAELRGDDTVWGYMIKDEPTSHTEYPPLAWRMQRLREADPTHVGYINLGGSLNGHHPLYLRMVKPDLLSYDYYQWSWGQDRHFSRLEEYRRGALEHGIPLMVWVHGNAGPPEIREDEYYYHAPDNEQRMRDSVFTSLAYGAKGIQWFHGKHMFAGDHLRPNGEDVARINAELRHLGPALIELRSVEVYHTPPLPPDTRAIPDDSPVQVSGGEIVLGVMEHPREPRTDYFMLANRDHTAACTATLQFREPVRAVQRLDKTTGQWRPLPVEDAAGGSRVEVALAAGDGELLRAR